MVRGNIICMCILTLKSVILALSVSSRTLPYIELMMDDTYL